MASEKACVSVNESKENGVAKTPWSAKAAKEVASVMTSLRPRSRIARKSSLESLRYCFSSLICHFSESEVPWGHIAFVTPGACVRLVAQVAVIDLNAALSNPAIRLLPSAGA